MKRTFAKFAIALIAFAIIPAVIALADISVTLDGYQLEFDVPPQSIDGRTMVPLRAIFEALDATSIGTPKPKP